VANGDIARFRLIIVGTALMKTLLAMAVGMVPLLSTGIALAQNGNVMNGGGWGAGRMGGYGEVWRPILLVVIVGAVMLIRQQKGK
jgi:hypothetical protein